MSFVYDHSENFGRKLKPRKKFAPKLSLTNTLRKHLGQKMFVIKNGSGLWWVSGFNAEHQVVTMAIHKADAKTFTQAAAERFIDKHQGVGHGLHNAMIEEAT